MAEQGWSIVYFVRFQQREEGGSASICDAPGSDIASEAYEGETPGNVEQAGHDTEETGYTSCEVGWGRHSTRAEQSSAPPVCWTTCCGDPTQQQGGYERTDAVRHGLVLLLCTTTGARPRPVLAWPSSRRASRCVRWDAGMFADGTGARVPPVRAKVQGDGGGADQDQPQRLSAGKMRNEGGVLRSTCAKYFVLHSSAWLSTVTRRQARHRNSGGYHRSKAYSTSEDAKDWRCQDKVKSVFRMPKRS
ncbi:hypothetical protein G7046_g7969 [Stylonectria norvegica]|nr:hypothetical protein G7046_g7969 [Stylonectria norvegica]